MVPQIQGHIMPSCSLEHLKRKKWIQENSCSSAVFLTTFRRIDSRNSLLKQQRSILDYFGVDSRNSFESSSISRNSAKSSSTSRKYLKSSSHDDQLTVFPVDIKDYIVNLILSSKKYDILDKIKVDVRYESFYINCKNLQDLVYKSFGPQQFNIQPFKALSTAYIDIKFTEERDHEMIGVLRSLFKSIRNATASLTLRVEFYENDNSAKISAEDERFGIRDVEIIPGTTQFLHYRGESDADALKSTVYEG
ncbi:hypothetical protein LIER_04345 [Lithospermum erythrorhizon]|uniref:Uncharacterized protein n=1 Tax=Lithospermum erythrorhizon TaxID=34254 RepID=A0AAV3NWV0_LITER